MPYQRVIKLDLPSHQNNSSLMQWTFSLSKPYLARDKTIKTFTSQVKEKIIQGLMDIDSNFYYKSPKMSSQNIWVECSLWDPCMVSLATNKK
jgi:hypothetical protein